MPLLLIVSPIVYSHLILQRISGSSASKPYASSTPFNILKPITLFHEGHNQTLVSCKNFPLSLVLYRFYLGSIGPFLVSGYISYFLVTFHPLLHDSKPILWLSSSGISTMG